MKLIERDDLKGKIDRGDDFKLVMTLGAFGYGAKHIPGSVNASSLAQLTDEFEVDDEIVVYCSDEACVASVYAYTALERAGFASVRRYAGGISDWEQAGYPLEGEFVEEATPAAKMIPA